MKAYVQMKNDEESESERKWQLDRRIIYRKIGENSLGEKRLVRYKWSYCLNENKNKRCLLKCSSDLYKLMYKSYNN